MAQHKKTRVSSKTTKTTKTAKRAAPRRKPAKQSGWQSVASEKPIPRPIAAVSQGTTVSANGTRGPRRNYVRLVVRVLTWPPRAVFGGLWNYKWWLIYGGVLVVCLLVMVSESFRMSTVDVRFDANSVPMQAVPKSDTALVFGAGVTPDHKPTEYLKQRVATAVGLYKAGRVDSILMSGDNSSKHYDEPTVMKAYAVQLGAKSDDVVIDYAGFNTYDSCYRAHAIFGIKSVTVVTQGYHLPRAIMTCREDGITTIGVAATHIGRDWTASYIAREHISSAKAAVQMFTKPKPTVLGKTESP